MCGPQIPSAKINLLVAISVVGLTFLFPSDPLNAQDNKSDDKKGDPASASDVIEKTLSKIRDVEQLDKYISENRLLKQQNKSLQGQIASLGKKVAKLTKDLQEENARMKRQLLELPSFQLKSKIIGRTKAMAILQHKENNIRIRDDTEMSVLVKEGVWVLMKVEKISKEVVVLSFPELNKSITLYD